MRLTTRGRYAVTALLDLALQPTEQTITLAEIAARQSISVAYLEQLFAKLKRHGLVSSVRGANGGYHLARNADEITVLEIIEAVNETLMQRVVTIKATAKMVQCVLLTIYGKNSLIILPTI